MTCTNCTDRYTWIATYNNGETLNECNGIEHAVYSDIEQDKLTTLQWVSRSNGGTYANITKGPQETLILFRRRYIEVNPDGIHQSARPTVHGLGIEKTTKESTNGHYTFLMDDGSVLTSDNKNLV